MRDPSLLLKCEEFLLHPTVRALSLAQRVDFLEKKVRVYILSIHRSSTTTTNILDSVDLLYSHSNTCQNEYVGVDASRDYAMSDKSQAAERPFTISGTPDLRFSSFRPCALL